MMPGPALSQIRGPPLPRHRCPRRPRSAPSCGPSSCSRALGRRRLRASRCEPPCRPSRESAPVGALLAGAASSTIGSPRWTTRPALQFSFPQAKFINKEPRFYGAWEVVLYLLKPQEEPLELHNVVPHGLLRLAPKALEEIAHDLGYLVQLHLGKACLHPLQEVGNSPARGQHIQVQFLSIDPRAAACTLATPAPSGCSCGRSCPPRLRRFPCPRTRAP